ncbi:reverse transcriptase domain-containing protein [Malikia sp.]|uniref:reverse transcriptase domain-containing protein n=1 Tax=Malikia sp. TaxID=2070706 RepID=UPI0026103D1B|nr:reverse transcriptase domain-containing protein [Malikia sp.]MDD2728104.1 reverse transcriptase domain-containing protein [Malikia sp.]
MNKIFSYRLRKDLVDQEIPIHIFDSDFNYTKFRNFVSSRAKSESVKVVASCDISNFYDRLNLHRLENTLYAIKGINKSIVKLINELLLYWSGRDSYGIPVGSNASRILAEASLINVDKFLLSKKIDFCRYVDDYRFFARDASEAHSWLSILVERLSHEGLFLNTSKTTIIEARNANENTSTDENLVINSTVVDHEIEKIDVQAIKNDAPIIISGYSGLIPTKFRSIGKNDINKLEDESKLYFDKSILSNELIDPKDFTKHVRIAVAKELWTDFSEISNVLEKFPQFVPYYLDCVKKNSGNLEKSDKDLISKNMENIIKNPAILEYLKIYLIRFFSSEDFLKKNLVMECYSNLKRSEGIYLGRAILESIQHHVEREDVLRIKNGFIRADNSERRQIIKILKNNLNPNEFGAFYKNISLNINDFLYSFISES